MKQNLQHRIYQLLQNTSRTTLLSLAFILTANCSQQWDIEQLTLVSVSPDCKAGNIPANVRFSLRFNRPIKAESGVVHLTGGSRAISGKAKHARETLEYEPDEALDSDADYTLIIPEGVRDENGNPLDKEHRLPCHTEPGADTVPPVTTPSLAPNIFATAQSVVLTCTDNLSGCRQIIYTTDRTIPTPTNGTVINGSTTPAIPVPAGDTMIRYTAVDNAGNIAPYYEAVYSVSTTGYLVVGTESHFARGIGATPSHFEIIHSGQYQYKAFRDPVTQLLYITTGDGLFISNTNGATFTYRPIGGESVHADRRNVVVAGVAGIWVSNDGGNTFAEKTLGFGTYSPSARDIFIKDQMLYATLRYFDTLQSVNVDALVISNDGGDSFAIKTSVHGLPSGQANRLYVDGVNVYVGTEGGLGISTDGGNSFVSRTIAQGLGSNTISAIFASGTDVYLATAGGLSISHNGGATFVNRTQANGLPATEITGVYRYSGRLYAAFKATGVSYYGSVGIGASSDDGLTFLNYGSAQGHLGADVTSLFADNSGVYASTRMGLMKSVNNGLTYTHDLGHLASPWLRSGVAVSGNHLYVGSEWGLSYSQNGGASFITLHKQNGLDYSTLGYIQDVKIAGGKVFVATTNGLAISNVGNNSFTVKTTAHGLATNYLTKLFVEGSKVHVLAGNKINTTGDGGNSFTAIDLPGSNARDNFWISDNDILVVGNYDGLYRSQDGGANWMAFDGSHSWLFDMNNSYVAKGIFKENNTIYFGTELGLFVSQDNGATFDQATGYTFFANYITNILRRDSILYMGIYNSNIPDPVAPYERILNWSTDGVTFGTSPNQEAELGGGAVYGIERYLNPNGDG